MIGLIVFVGIVAIILVVNSWFAEKTIILELGEIERHVLYLCRAVENVEDMMLDEEEDEEHGSA